jgi:TetR/AcrR family acrAB operon transcriptional repressor
MYIEVRNSMRRTKEEADITRQKLLKAALVVFSRQGYADTRLEDIAEEAGVTRGAIYHHFGSKAELYNALAKESSEKVMPVINEALVEGGTALEILKRVLVRTLVYVETDPEFRAINELVLFKTGVTPEMADGMKKKIEGTRQMVNFVAQTIEQGIRVGDIRRDIEAKDAAITFLALQNGLLTFWLLDPDQFSLEERAESMADIFIRGIAAE